MSLFVEASLKGLPEKIELAYRWLLLLGEQYKPGTNSIVMPIDWSCGIVTSAYEAESIAQTVVAEEAIQLKKELVNLV